eukprot:2386002-Pyramimonas_sp.AAC.1
MVGESARRLPRRHASLFLRAAGALGRVLARCGHEFDEGRASGELGAVGAQALLSTSFRALLAQAS